MDFSQRLKALRTEKKLSQTEVAEAINIKQRNISFFETARNEPNLTTLIALAKYFNVTTDYLLGISDSK